VTNTCAVDGCQIPAQAHNVEATHAARSLRSAADEHERQAAKLRSQAAELDDVAGELDGAAAMFWICDNHRARLRALDLVAAGKLADASSPGHTPEQRQAAQVEALRVLTPRQEINA
jgi:hypothetical protein